MKHSNGIQEQLPVTIKYGSDTRPWTGLYERARPIQRSYQELVRILGDKHRLSLIVDIDKDLNNNVCSLMKNYAQMFEQLQFNNKPCYYKTIWSRVTIKFPHF